MRQFFKDALYVQVLNFLIKPIWILVIDRAVQNLLPPEHYVAYYTWLSFTILFVIVLDVGINTYNNTHVAKDHTFLNTHLSSFLKVKLYLSAFYVFLVLVFALLVGLPLQELKLLVMLTVYQIIVSLTQFFRSNITALGWYKKEGWLSISDRLVTIVICAIFLWVPAFKPYLTVDLFIAFQVIGIAVSLLLSVIMLQPYLGKILPTSDKGILKKILKETWPYALLVALMGIYTRIDVVMLRYLSVDGTLETDAYAMGYRLLDAGSMMIAVFSGLLLPAFASELKKKDTIKRLSHFAYGFIFLIAVPGVILSGIYAEEAMQFLYPDRNNAIAPNVFAWLMRVLPAAGLIYVFGALLTAAKELKFLNRLALIIVFINTIGNALLIPKYGAIGASWATVTSQWIFAFGCVMYSYKLYEWKLSTSQTIKWSIWLLAMSLVSLYIIPFISNWFWSVLLLMGFAFVAAFILEIAGLKEGRKVILERFSNSN
jgi:O-antigen/teichoic acid export membrane protein